MISATFNESLCSIRTNVCYTYPLRRGSLIGEYVLNVTQGVTFTHSVSRMITLGTQKEPFDNSGRFQYQINRNFFQIFHIPLQS